jgi:hypothetical protein
MSKLAWCLVVVLALASCAPAPVAEVAISFRRDELRTKSKPATLAQAISKTNPTAHEKMKRWSRREAPVNQASCTGDILTPKSPLVSGYSCARRVAIVSMATCACSIETPGLRRAVALRMLRPESGRPATQINAFSLAKKKPGGMTPTTVTFSRLILKFLPITLGSFRRVAPKDDSSG